MFGSSSARKYSLSSPSSMRVATIRPTFAVGSGAHAGRTFEHERWQDELEESEKAARGVTVPGFRNGTARVG